MANQHTNRPAEVPVAVGQVRRDAKNGTIIVKAETPARQYLCEYPQLHGESLLLSTKTIMDLYPFIVSEPR